MPGARSRQEGGRRAAGSRVAEAPLATGLIEDPPVQLISQEPSPGVRYEYHLPLSVPGPGFSWSHGSWSECSAECGGGEGLARGLGSPLLEAFQPDGRRWTCR